MDVAASDWFTDSAPVERLPCASEAKVVIVLVDGHRFTINVKRSVESWSLSLRVVPRIADSIVFDREEISNVTWVSIVVHLSVSLRERVPMRTSCPTHSPPRLC